VGRASHCSPWGCPRELRRVGRATIRAVGFVCTNVRISNEGYLACDAEDCDERTEVIRLGLGPLPVEGWVVVQRRRRVQPSGLCYFCPEHAPGYSVPGQPEET
jgi:hypothetical protein